MAKRVLDSTNAHNMAQFVMREQEKMLYGHEAIGHLFVNHI